MKIDCLANPGNPAISMALSSIRVDRYFPQNVFVRTWDYYLFFDPWPIGSKKLVALKDLLLRIEGSSSIALINLGDGATRSPKAILFGRETREPELHAELASDEKPASWAAFIDRFVCASDKGTWCMYFEKDEDMGVFALDTRSSVGSARSEIQKLLGARSIQEVDQPDSVGLFRFGPLLPTWRSILYHEYTDGPSPARVPRESGPAT